MTIQEFEVLPDAKKQAAYLDFLRYENEALKKEIATLKEQISKLEAEASKGQP